MENMRAPLAVAKVVLAQVGVNAQMSYLLAKLIAQVDPKSNDADLWAHLNTLFEKQRSVNTAFEDLLAMLEGAKDA